MASSGTVSQTVFQTQKVIEHALRRCKLPAQSITAEMLQLGLENLWLLLSDMANKGVPLWTIETKLLGFFQGDPRVPTPVGTVDVINANLRTMQRVTGSYTSTSGTASNAFDSDVVTEYIENAVSGHITMDTGTGAQVTTIGILPGVSGTWGFTLSYSDDDITYIPYQTESNLTVADKQWWWIDVNTAANNIPTAHRYWRLAADASTVFNIRELYYGNTPNEITMGILNIDDYFNLPDKTFQGRPLQFWLDRQRDVPILTVWPAPDNPSLYSLISTQCTRQIQDVGTLQQTLDIPQRWYQGIVWSLAKALAAEVPEVATDKVMPTIISGIAETMPSVWAEEHSEGPLVLQPNLAVYTR